MKSHLKTTRKTAQDESQTPVEGFPIVGIGASAGGLAAFEQFFEAMPTDGLPPIAFVLVQHLAPDHKSILTELIKRYTPMEVFEVEDGMQVRPNCVFIIPPNRDMALMNGVLHLLEQSSSRSLRLPIDFFFQSLAQDQSERAICIVLSGTGSDGTLGLRAIKAAGGMAMVQSPESTEFNGMPTSAIHTGLADYVLSPVAMPVQLLAYIDHAFGKLAPRVQLTGAVVKSALCKIYTLVRAETGHDFSNYKQNTIVRRIERRMALHQISQMDDYVAYLQNSPDETESLFLDFLIGVTQFFRDPAEFEILREKVIPSLFAHASKGEAIRVWVPGCSTGEEAYSIAILLKEQMEALKQSFKVQIFATDIDHRAIHQARKGIYPSTVAAHLSPERFARFFIQEPGSANYQIQKEIRDLMVFSEQDVTKDPPFSNLDLISCRNLLIYMDDDLQKKLVQIFAYSLKPGGALFLGNSETVGSEARRLFEALNSSTKIYRRTGEPVGPLFAAPRVTLLPPATGEAVAIPLAKKHLVEGTLRELTQQQLLREYAPAAVLVNPEGDVLYFHGHTGLYLEPPPGVPVLNILKMAKEGLRQNLSFVLHKAVMKHALVKQSGVLVQINEHAILIHLAVRPVAAAPKGDDDTTLFLVTLEPMPEAAPKPEPTAEGEVDARIVGLKEELRLKDEYLQSMHEEMEASNHELRSSNEEMKSINEELQSTNEELQSTNEELATAKEELQSLNEELSTVNVELQNKLADLAVVNNDMNNLLVGTGISTVFVDSKLRVKRFSPTITGLIHLIETDVGRPVGEIALNLIGYDHLVEDLKSVLDTLVPKEIEVQTTSHVWYLLGIRPYRTVDNVIQGATLTFVEIDKLKKAQEALQR